MDNLGKALVMAGFAFLFIVAATTSIYLYGNLNSFLDTTTKSISTDRRAEMSMENDRRAEISMENTTTSGRVITKSEIYITLFNLNKMHVWSIVVDGREVTQDDLNEYNMAINPNITKVGNLISYLNNVSVSQTYSYSCSVINVNGKGETQVTYTKK